MAWDLKAELIESCSCAALCPCTLGPAKPDQGWCSGILAFDVTGGKSDGVDLKGSKVVMHFELPGDFLGGIDKAKLYIDANEDQTAALTSIFHGERGGLWEGMKGAIKQWLPSQATKVEFMGGSGVKVPGVGEITLEMIKNEDGNVATLTNAPVLGAFQIGTAELAFASGGFSDPDLRSWESLGEGSTARVDWKG